MDISNSNYDNRYVATLDDPEEFHRDMRAKCPVQHSENYGGFWALTRYEEVEAATRDTARFSSLPTITLPSVGAPRPFIPMESDPPEHAKYRSLLNVVFSARRIAELEGEVRKHAVQLIEGFASAGEADLARDLAFPLTSRVITWLLGIPDEDVSRFSAWSLGLVSVATPEEGMALQMEIRDYYVQLIAARRDNPTKDLASHLLASTIDDRPVTEEEALDIYLSLTGAGGETTAAAANHIFTLIDRHPELRSQLQAERELLPSAIEEFLRYVTPVPGFGRTTTTEVEVAGTVIPEGERVWMSWLSANHDETAFDEPAKIVLDRKPNRHLAFGAGVHRCPGAPLARLELRIMLEEILDRIPDYRVTDPTAVRISEGQTRVIRSLPIVFTPQP
ncbi:cytochrome P450 [Rhodococcus sp. WS4]|nr:cytochrome P450 [Rhodococcus sp. WS4]